MEFRHDDKVIIVTGAASGIGRSIAETFLANGGKVLLVDYDSALLQQTIAVLQEKYDKKAEGMVADLRQAHIVGKKIVDTAIDKFGQVDILVNNAGIYPSKYALDVEENDWNRIFDLNVKGYFFMAQAIARYLTKNHREGIIVNIASTAAKVTRPGAVPYATSKAAVAMLTQGLALEWIRKEIRVNAIAPGLVETEALLASLTTDEDKAEHKEKISFIPIARTGLAEEIAEAVLFLASDKAKYIVGQTLFVDGGYTTGRVYQSKQG